MKKIMLVKIAWMKYYEGRANIDIPMSGAKYIKENKNGGEVYNFKNTNGKVYGSIPFNHEANINNLGATNQDEAINDVLIVFCATHPKEGIIRVVGWYKKATVYRYPKLINKRNYYHIESKFNDCTLIPYTDRTLRIPKVFGRNSVCYIANHKSKVQVLKKIEEYITSGGKSIYRENNAKSGRVKKGGFPKQPDIGKRILVEQTAINIAKEYYSVRYGCENVHSVEKDNVGWDLEVRNQKKILLKVEVKGLSGSVLSVQLSPNEFNAFNLQATSYRLFVVTNTLSKSPTSRIFEYQSKGNLWVANDKSQLKIETLKSARLKLK